MIIQYENLAQQLQNKGFDSWLGRGDVIHLKTTNGKVFYLLESSDSTKSPLLVLPEFEGFNLTRTSEVSELISMWNRDREDVLLFVSGNCLSLARDVETPADVSGLNDLLTGIEELENIAESIRTILPTYVIPDDGAHVFLQIYTEEGMGCDFGIGDASEYLWEGQEFFRELEKINEGSDEAIELDADFGVFFSDYFFDNSV